MAIREMKEMVSEYAYNMGVKMGRRDGITGVRRFTDAQLDQNPDLSRGYHDGLKAVKALQDKREKV